LAVRCCGRYNADLLLRGGTMISMYGVLTWMYLAVPLLAFLWALARARRTCSFSPLRGFALTALAGIAAGLTVCVLYSLSLHARIGPSQLLITCYWAFSIASLVVALNHLLIWGIGKLFTMGLRQRSSHPAAQVAGSMLRATLLLGIGVPYVLMMVLVYRPKVVRAGTPLSLLEAPYQNVSFRATDGTKLQGWWIPATRTSRTDNRHPAQDWGNRTIILCHGFGADKAADLRMARDLVPNGYNVLAFDFRAHGQSGGQFTTFGALERNDVLGAVRWVKQNHAQEAKKIYGLGESMGAAALINAAADQSDEGQSIDAIAVFAPFDRLTTLLKGAADSHYAPAAGWLAARICLPVASVQFGVNLFDFAPATLSQSLWPRPILVLASDQDRGVDVHRCRALYEQAMQPKFRYWAEKGSRETLLFADDDASLAVRIFFETSRSIL